MEEWSDATIDSEGVLPSSSIESTPLQLNYALLGLNDVRALFVIRSEATLVQQVLKEIGPDLKVPARASELEFWLLKEPIPVRQYYSNPWLLDPSANLTDYATEFPRAIRLFSVWESRDSDFLHVVLRLSVSSNLKRRLSSPEYPAQKRPNLEEAHRAAISLGLKAAAPSSASKVGAIAKQQKQYPLYNGRPPENRGFDVRLFHPAFENFSRRYHGAEELAGNEGTVHKFMVCSADYYDNEKARQGVVTPLLETLLAHDIGDIRNHPDETSANGTVLFVQSGTQVPTLLFKLKNEIGTGDADATHEVGLLYRKFWSRKTDSQRRASCCPTFLLALMGSWLCVLGAVFTDKPIVQPLTPLLWLGHAHARKPQYREVTRLFAALSMGISELEAFYSDINFGVVSEARFFPYVTSFSTDTGSKVQFSYIEYADPDPETSKAVFIASTQDKRKIVVKFAEAYNEEAHSLLAAKDLAPRLLSCDRSVSSNFVMVVMDYVDGEQLFHKYPLETPHKILEEVLDALGTLRKNDLVFGDLRSPNILITGQHHVQLVDFNWCGKAGEGKYPADINTVDIEWPNGVVPGGFLQFEHDKKMLWRLSYRA